MKPLHLRNAAALSILSQSNVEKSLSSTQRNYATNQWLGKTNRYIRDTVKKLARDTSGSGSIKSRHLAQYIAVSSLLHCSDGWSYLGRAMQALLRGDANAALHLAYYAELRAAMSILATEGVGTFNKSHFIISGPNQSQKLPVMSSTHEFVWSCFSYWASQPSSTASFASVIRPHGVPLMTWLLPLGGGATIAPHAQGWFQQWGIDLRLFAEDRDARNTASYRPSGIASVEALNAEEVARFADELWSILEPTASSNFEVLDSHILRITLENLFRGRTGRKASGAPEEFGRMLNSILEQQSLNESAVERWSDFLKRRSSPTDALLLTHSAAKPRANHQDCFSVISRATLLLRFASGATDKLFKGASISREAVSFWRNGIGASRGLWAAGDEPEMLTDLWTDVAIALEDVREFYNGTETNRSFYYLGTQMPRVLASLGGCERVAVWSLVVN